MTHSGALAAIAYLRSPRKSSGTRTSPQKFSRVQIRQPPLDSKCKIP